MTLFWMGVMVGIVTACLGLGAWGWLLLWLDGRTRTNRL